MERERVCRQGQRIPINNIYIYIYIGQRKRVKEVPPLEFEMATSCPVYPAPLELEMRDPFRSIRIIIAGFPSIPSGAFTRVSEPFSTISSRA